MKIIGIVGPRQTGSTLLFNLVRIALMNKGYKVDSCWVDQFDKGLYEKNVDYLIVKAHFFSEKLQKNALIILLTLRDFRDSFISHTVRFNDEKLTAYILTNIKMYDEWLQFAKYVFKYEKYATNPYEMIKELVTSVLGLTVSMMDIVELRDMVDKLWENDDIVQKDDMSNKFYAKTLLTTSHNTSGGKVGKYLREFTKSQHDEIKNNKEIREFMEKNGYKLL